MYVVIKVKSGYYLIHSLLLYLENNPPEIKAFPPSIHAMYGTTSRVIFRVTDDKDTSITVKLTTETSMEHSFTKQSRYY